MDAYKDEILFSMLARSQNLMGHFKTKTSLRNLFKNDHRKVSVDFPVSIKLLVEQKVIECSPSEAISQYTLFPFYKPFLSSSQVHRAVQDMLEGNGPGIHCTTGVMASVVKSNTLLRFCSVCIREDTQIYGEPYWHCQHQLPGVLVCPIHKCILQTNCNVCNQSMSFGGIRQLTICPTFCSHGHDLSEQEEKETDEMIVKISRAVANLFKRCKAGEIPDNIDNLYCTRLKQLNLCSVNSRIRQQEVKSQFQSYFKKEVLGRVGVPYPEGQHDWLPSILRKPRVSYHPLLHVLVILFLWDDVNQLPINVEYMPFGSAPWPCLNKSSEHFRGFTIQEVKVSRCSDTKKPVGSFDCDICGFGYSRRGPDLLKEDIFWYGRVKDFGHEWRRETDMLLDKGGSIRSIARSMNVDSKTITHYRDKKNLTKIESLSDNDFERELRRGRFLKTIDDSSENSGTQELIKRNQKDYNWLYRNDREWLRSVLPASEKLNKSNTSRVNWAERDKELSKLINKTILELHSSNIKPVRITVSRIGRHIGKLALLERHLDRLPICRGILQINIESEEKHQIHRIDWAVRTLKQKGETLAKWRVLREGGIRIIKSEEVEQYLVTKMNEIWCPIYESASA